ncbi:putative transporter [Yarrowia sp. E02]|nr:putative transporter [Yarrowia sp. E02]
MTKKEQASNGSDDIDTASVISSYDDVIDGSGENKTNPFADPRVAQQFRDIYEKSEYECRHLFDPEMEWTEEEEKRVKRKLEWRVTGWACIMFMALQIDRANLGQALADNLLDDLGLTTDDYNYGNTIFLLSFMSAEIPSQLISKRLGPDRWIPLQICMWSIVAMSQGALSGRTSFFVTRSLIGLIEGGFIPDLVLWLSYFYKSKELPIRLSFFYTTMYGVNILTGLLAFGLLRIRLGGLQGWRWLFIIEGFMTLLIGVASFFRMPASAAQTKTRFRKKGWFTDREEKIVVNRVLRDDPYKGDFNNRQAITFKNIFTCLSDYHMWPIYAIGITIYIGATPVGLYMTLTMREIGFSPFNTNLLTIPPQVLRVCNLLLATWLSEYFNQRALFTLIEPLWSFGMLFALRFYSGILSDAWSTYAIITVTLGGPYVHAIVISWASRNSNTVAQRTMSAAVYNMCNQASGVIAANIYRADDFPKFTRGNTQLIAISGSSVVLVLLVKAYYMAVNKHRDKVWAKMSKEERADYKANSKDTGSHRLDFRFAH